MRPAAPDETLIERNAFRPPSNPRDAALNLYGVISISREPNCVADVSNDDQREGVQALHLEDRRQPLTAADAHRLKPVARLAAAHFVKQGGGNASAGNADRVAQ